MAILGYFSWHFFAHFSGQGARYHHSARSWCCSHPGWTSHNLDRFSRNVAGFHDSMISWIYKVVPPTVKYKWLKSSHENYSIYSYKWLKSSHENYSYKWLKSSHENWFDISPLMGFKWVIDSGYNHYNNTINGWNHPMKTSSIYQQQKP